ncbi:hypothetical protein CKAH01_02057 [Colletotrichum kahawae]|uniref:Uncharacterized protein n=1 Tax=Colletotrichum kahawae TaxID=34407 RepID=A0AAD9Y2R5_COLKA|nr:hypothetical protein CKAH01_02057 [Colletotrichum kahawae]
MASSTAAASGRDSDENIANLWIREIRRHFQGERLIVQPLEWTARHLQLLRCTINELPESSRNPSQLQPVPNTPQPSPEVATDWARTVVTRYPGEVARAVGSLLEFYSFTKLSLPQHDDNKAAFTDPYIAAILIAQAQRLRKENAHSNRTTDPRVKSSKTYLQYKVQLLKSVQMGIRRKQLWLYTAFVTDAFLDKLAYPSQRSESHLDIWYRGIESEPYETFPQRVIEAMHHNPRGEKRRGGDDELENQDGPQSCTAKR